MVFAVGFDAVGIPFSLLPKRNLIGASRKAVLDGGGVTIGRGVGFLDFLSPFNAVYNKAAPPIANPTLPALASVLGLVAILVNRFLPVLVAVLVAV